MRIKISSRKSDLARIQAMSVGDALKKSNPEIEIEYAFRESLGDKNLKDPLWQMPEKGVFTEDFLEDLKNEKTDLVVHSWKDLPVEDRKQTIIAATLPREDARDVLLIKKSKIQTVAQTGTLRIFSSSPRRAYNIDPFLKEAWPAHLNKIIFEPVRGNVPTRLEKLFSENSDGLVVAKAALDRLVLAPQDEFKGAQKRMGELLQKCLFMVIPIEKNPSAAAQGALALEVKKGRKEILDLVGKINCPRTFASVQEERRRLKNYGGGCHQKVGVSVRQKIYGDLICTRALTDRGQKIDTFEFFAAEAPPRTSAEKIFPSFAGEGVWFDREFFDVDLPAGPIWVAKSEALPEKAKIENTRLVWASGFETWKKLAKRGVWVSGCNEGLGESEEQDLRSLFGGRVEWTKLTHDRGFETAGMKVFPTYKLVPKAKLPSLEGKTHFYWLSGSSFLQALKECPWIKDAFNSCGPGNTYEIISRETQVTLFPSYKLWREQVVK